MEHMKTSIGLTFVFLSKFSFPNVCSNPNAALISASDTASGLSILLANTTIGTWASSSLDNIP